MGSFDAAWMDLIAWPHPLEECEGVAADEH